MSVVFIATVSTVREEDVLDDLVTQVAKAILKGDFKFLDDLNNSFKCCYFLDGLGMYSIDWFRFNGIYPKSCCKKLTDDESCIKNNLHDRGCIEGVKISTKNYKYFSIVIFTLGLIFEFSLIFSSFGLLRHFRSV